MDLFIYHNTVSQRFHASLNGGRTGCGITVKGSYLQLISHADITLNDFRHKVNCQGCLDSLTPLFPEEKPSGVVLEKTPPATEEFTSAQEINAVLQGKILKLYLGSEKTVSIPDYVEMIHDSAFARCSELTSVEIPECVAEICDFAFALCTSLKEITLPQSVKLGKNVFYECSALETVKIRFPGGIVGTFGKEALDTMFLKS